MRILHLSADFPDPLRPGKTRAISNLVNLIDEHEHLVYSLNRIDGARGIEARDFGDRHRTVAYGAPPKGIFLARRLDALADWIVADLARRGLRPDLVHAHKLSVEGLAGERVAARLGLPLVVSSQGNSDLRIMNARRDLLPRWRRIWQDAAVVLPFAPWTAERLVRMLGPRSGPTTCLPCPTESDRIMAPHHTGDRILSAFRLDQAANKNLALLVAATDILQARHPGVELSIAGGGSAADRARVLRRIGGRAHVRLLGQLDPHEIQKTMNASALLVVPSLRESYGMVFAEALLAGCPVVHGRENGPSGYFAADWARSAPPGGAHALARLMEEMLDAQSRMKRELAGAQQEGALDLLRRPAIADRYREALARAATGRRAAA